MSFRFHIEKLDEQWIAGWGFDPAYPAERLEVEVLATGRSLGSGTAATLRPDLARVGLGDGKCGFRVQLQGATTSQPVRVVLRNHCSGETAETEAWLKEPEGVVVFPADQAQKLKPRGLLLSSSRGRAVFGPGTWFEPPVVVHSVMTASIQVGSFTGIYGGSVGSAAIGRYCSIAPNVTIGPNEHPTDWLSTSLVAENPTAHDWDEFARPGQRERMLNATIPFPSNLKRTIIGNDVWVGSNTLILKGVKIGDGAIVAGGSVVTRDVPPYAVVAGVPARVKRLRFDEATIERLLALRWWRYALHDLTDLPLSDMPRLLDLLEDRLASGDIPEWAPDRITPADICTMLAQPGKTTN